MTDAMTDTQRAERPEPARTVIHKATRDCPITEPHPSTICGLVQARRRAQAAGDAPPPPPPPPDAPGQRAGS